MGKVTVKRVLTVAVCLLFSVGILFGGGCALRYGYTAFYRSIYPLKYETLVYDACDEFGVSPSLVLAIIHTESDFQPDVASTAGAKGLMQMTEDTFLWALRREGNERGYTLKDIYDPSVNIRYGVYVIFLLQQRFSVEETVVAAYNAGQGRVANWLSESEYSQDGETLAVIPFSETRNYVRRVMTAKNFYQQLYMTER